jgi:hypothetical protein
MLLQMFAEPCCQIADLQVASGNRPPLLLCIYNLHVR